MFWFAACFAPDGGDSAEGAFFVAALADAEVCPVWRGDSKARSVVIGDMRIWAYGGYGFVGGQG